MALGTIERVQFIARFFRFYAEQPHLFSALGTVGPFNRSGIWGGWLVSDHSGSLFWAGARTRLSVTDAWLIVIGFFVGDAERQAITQKRARESPALLGTKRGYW